MHGFVLGRSCGSVQTNRDEAGEFVIVLDNLVLVVGLTIACEQALLLSLFTIFPK